MLKFIRVTKKYNADKPALDSVSFDIDSGELVVITGPSGSGKTTLLKLITKEQDPSEGEIYFKEENVNTLKKSKVPYHRRKIGSVFQDYKLLPELNIWENIALALSILGHPDHEIEEKVTDLLKLVSLTDKAFLFPHQLSGGEAQRISIARALSTAPELIFADEPTGNLDASNSLIIAKLLKKINDLGTTVMVTTHDPVVIKHLASARMMELKEGVLTDSDENNSKKKKAPEAQEKKVEDKEENKDKKEEEFPKAKDNVKEKKKSKFNFFGMFGKKKKKAEEDKKDDKKDEVSKSDKDSKENKEELTKSEDKKEETIKEKKDIKKVTKSKEDK
jgi:cell division transport system ATP-binding protein